ALPPISGIRKLEASCPERLGPSSLHPSILPRRAFMSRSMSRFALGVSVVLLLSPAARADGIMIEGFYWDTTSPDSRSWWDFLSDHSLELKEMGVTSFWAPPATKGAGGTYSSGYDIYDYYDLGSKDQKGSIRTRYGTKEQYLAFIGIAHAN